MDGYRELLTIREQVLVSFIGIEDGDILFEFNTDGTSELVHCVENRPEPFTKYKRGKSYDAGEVIDDIVQYAISIKPALGFPKKDEIEKQIIAEELQKLQSLMPREKPQSADTTTLERILRTVERIDQRSAQHPLVLQDEHKSLERLYVGAINDNLDNLQVFEYEGQRIPYVLVDSSDLEGNVGKPSNNLYFVAKDIATEPWQQQIVAYHESLCIQVGHEEAKKRELPLARFLGKEEEYLKWREKIDNVF